MGVSQTIFDECTDDLEHEKTIHIYDPVSKLKSIVVVDNVAAGLATCGVRMASDRTTTQQRQGDLQGRWCLRMPLQVFRKVR